MKLLILFVPFFTISFLPTLRAQDWEFVLSLQWPNGLCAIPQQQCHDDLRTLGRFTIHGYWKRILGVRGGVSDTFCRTPPPPIPWNPQLQATLARDWPSYFIENEQFWEDEWAKHGTCSNNVDHPVTYFEAVLRELHESRINDNIRQHFAEGFYHPSELVDIIYRITDVYVEVECEQTLNAKGKPIWVFTGIKFCYSNIDHLKDCLRDTGSCYESDPKWNRKTKITDERRKVSFLYMDD